MSKRYIASMRPGITAVLAVALSACSGLIEAPSASEGGLWQPNGPGGPGGPGDGVPGSTVNPLVCTAAARAPIRRLTTAEYQNTVRDLFPGLSIPNLGIARDPLRGAFDNDANYQPVTTLLMRQYSEAAITITDLLAPRLSEFIGCDPSTNASCGREFIQRFGAKAFRRPLAEDELTALQRLYDSGPAAGNFPIASRLVIETLLQSPQFLYRPELGAGTAGKDARLASHEVANRLSYFLWASMPDETLFQAAEKGELETTEQIVAQADRMLADPRAKEGILLFFREWLDLPAMDTVRKLESDKLTDQLRADIKASAERFAWDLFEAEKPFEDLLLSPRAYVNAPIAALLDVPAPSSGWGYVDLDPTRRAGLLTQPAFLLSRAHAEYGSPVLRGVYVMSRFLCAPPNPPPPGAALGTPDHGSDATPVTNREAYEKLTASAQPCKGCHSSINQFGYAFENYDTMGRFVSLDNARPIDASGEVYGFAFDNGVELMQQLAESEAASECFVEQWIDFALGGSSLAKDPCFKDDVMKVFQAKKRSARALVRAIVTHPKFARAELPAVKE